MKSYDHRKVEASIRKFWARKKFYRTPDMAKGKDNFYLLVEFPYPSGNLHVGHWYAFAVPDILARMQRMRGHNVLYPIGFDAFGLPAENAAIQRGLNPRKWTEKNIAYMKKQIESMGTSFDWSRQVSTIDPRYYKWTQWLFLQLYKKGLAYQKDTSVNWCPKDKTVLANEQVVEGHCERCGSEVVQRQMLQWNLRITEYADRLVDDLEALDWPEQIKESQRNWIGRSEGYEIDFPLVLEADKKYTYVLLHGYTGSPRDPHLQWLKGELEKRGHKVVVPELPNTNDPDEDSQVSAALKATDYGEHTVLFGHSLGGTVALKVLEKLERPIARAVFAGAVVSPKFKDKRRLFEKKFKWKFDGKRIRKNAGGFTILHDPRDYAISDEQRAALERILGVKAELCHTSEPHFTGGKERDLLRWLMPMMRVFTTRPDTLYGGTYLVLAPEHRWLQLALAHETVLKNNDEIAAYVERAKRKTELERQETKEKTGVELKGVKAVNPATGKEIPIWVADFVIGTYGSGAIFADAHDERDWEFARKFGIPLKETLEPLVVRGSGVDAVRPEEAFVQRKAVMAVVRRHSDGKFLCIHYRPTSTNGFVSGAVEKGETATEAARREIREETGYTDVSLVRQLGRPVHSRYYSIFRRTNTAGEYLPLLFDMNSDARVDVAEDERERHEVRWLDAQEVSGFINRDDYRYAWDRYTDKAYTGKGILYDSDGFDGMTSEEAIPAIGERFGRKVRQYRLRDWIVSRQRYWGVPIPIIHCPKCGAVPVPEKDLPVKLPEVKDYLPEGSGKSPLAKAKKWVSVRCPKCHCRAERETDTLDTFVDSSWYFLRYTDPKNKRAFASAKKMGGWMPVDLYSGGAEHTTMHLLYSRFWQKALYDLGLVKQPEPYKRRMNRSIILGPDGQKMSKSHGNVIDPDALVEKVGADTVRMYLAFIGPYNEVGSFPWNPDGVAGIRRFLERVWRAQEYIKDSAPELEAGLHRTIKKVGEDVAALKFNTAIAQLMIFLNQVEKQKRITHTQWDAFVKMLAPFSPYIAEALWQTLGHKTSVHDAKWPDYDPREIQGTTKKFAVQVNGKTRGEAEIPLDATEAQMQEAAHAAIAERLIGKKVARTIVVPGRLVNFVLDE